MNAKKQQPENLKMSGEEFDRIMRGALQAPVPKKPPKKSGKKSKSKLGK